jgi:hypothetical protein
MRGSMATPKPGEIRCPTCHRSTPPAAYCTQCGSPIPADARARPRGMDRDELQERLRSRRSGGDPYRRGYYAGEEPPGYDRFEPDDMDAQARRGPRTPREHRVDYFAQREAAGPVVPPPDVTREPEPERYERWYDATRDAAGSSEGYEATAPPPPGTFDEPTYVDNFDDAAYYGEGDESYGYAPWHDRRRRGSGGAGIAILGVLALGVLALMGGAVLAGAFGNGGVAQTTPSATASVTAAPTPSVEPTVAPSVAASPSAVPSPSGGPVTFPDGFVAQAQPCLPGSAGTRGCNSNGATNSGTVDIWVGFEKGTADDVLGATLLGTDGTVLAEGTIDLARIGCARTCNGWTRFTFPGLDPGSYEVRITRNGEFASSTTFQVV